MARRVPHQGKDKLRTKPIPPDVDKMRDVHSDRIAFSFHFLDLTHNKFHVDGRQPIYFQKLIDRLKLLSGIEKKQLSSYSNKTLRFHPIKWEDTTEPCFGIPHEEWLVEEPLQFSISANEHGRV